MTRRGFISMAACATALRGQPSAQRGREIVDKVVLALGGDGFKFMGGRVESGRAYSFYREQITGLSIATIHTKYLPASARPALLMKQRQEFGKKRDDVVLLSDQAAWEITYRGAKQLPADRVETFKTTTIHDIFYILRSRIDEPGMTFEAHGRDVVENQPVETIEIYDSENQNVTAWFHQDTLLPVKQKFKRWDTVINVRREEITRFTKYRDAGNGVMWPHDTQRERDQQKIFELYADKVTVGETPADSLFELPPGVTIINKK
jgi:hypothetical protein